MNCHYFKTNRCKSCSLLDNSYPNTLLLKESDLKSHFPQYLEAIKPTLGLRGDATGSRSKAKFAVYSHEGKPTFGFYTSEGQPRELENCPLHAEGINALLQGISGILQKYKIAPYELKSQKGELKYLLISTSGTENSAELLLRFVLRSKDSLPLLKKAMAELLTLSSLIKVITANIQPVHQAILEGEEEIVLTKESVIIHQFDEFRLALGARSFFQVTPEIAKALYNSVAEAVKEDKPSSLIDLYCGVGAFSFYASRYCEDITGVEISKEAIECAKISVELNNRKINFEAMDVEEYLKGSERTFEAVLVNPPRRGLNSEIIKIIKKLEPRVVYYSSCNVRTLARDFAEMRDQYEIRSLQVFDMFPYTEHYETLMCLVSK